MSAALLNAILVVAFLTMYVMAGEVLIGVRRHRRRRTDDAHAADDRHWHGSANELLGAISDKKSDVAA